MNEPLTLKDLVNQAAELYLHGGRGVTFIGVARHLKQKYPEEFTVTTNAFRKRLIRKVRKHIKTTHPAVSEYLEESGGGPVEAVRHYWDKGARFSIFLGGQETITYEDIRDDMIKEMAEYSPQYPAIDRDFYMKVKQDRLHDPHLLLIDPADVHVGKLSMLLGKSSEYNSKIAVQRVHDGVRGLLRKASGEYLDKIVFMVGNDILHTDNTTRGTSKGTPQDTDGMWYTNFKTAKQLYVDMIELCMQVADVHVIFNPSNHDFMSGFFLADSVATWFRQSDNVTFDVGIEHRKYFRYHNTLIGTTHGDGVKGERLASIMPEEMKEDWALSDHRYWYLHHIHHKQAKDHGSVSVEYLRSLSGDDMWHHIKGFCNQPKAIEGFLHSSKHGQVARLTHIFQ